MENLLIDYDILNNIHGDINSSIIYFMENYASKKDRKSETLTHSLKKIQYEEFFTLPYNQINNLYNELNKFSDDDRLLTIEEYNNNDSCLLLKYEFFKINKRGKRERIEPNHSTNFCDDVFELSEILFKIIEDYIHVKTEFLNDVDKSIKLKYHVFMNKGFIYIYFPSIHVSINHKERILGFIEYINDLDFNNIFTDNNGSMSDYRNSLLMDYNNLIERVFDEDDIKICYVQGSYQIKVPMPTYGKNPTKYYFTGMREYIKKYNGNNFTVQSKDVIKVIEDIKIISIYDNQHDNTVLTINIQDCEDSMIDESSDNIDELETIIDNEHKTNMRDIRLFMKRIIKTLYFEQNCEITETDWEDILILSQRNIVNSQTDVLAKWFSLQTKFHKDFNNKWEDIKKNPYKYEKKINDNKYIIRSLIHKLKHNFNNLYNNILNQYILDKLNQSVSNTLTTYVSDNDISELVSILFIDKFVYSNNVWYYFNDGFDNTTNNNTRIKNIWVEADEDAILQFINTKSDIIYKKYKDIENSKLNLMKDTMDVVKKLGYDLSVAKKNKYGKYSDNTDINKKILNVDVSKDILKKLRKSYDKMNTNMFSKSVREVLKSILTNPRFYSFLDMDPYIFGVANGILELDARDINDPNKVKVRFIDKHHNYLISRNTETIYKPYDPDDFYVKEIYRIFSEIIIEPDAFEFIFIHWASGLDSSDKQNILLQICGSGENGKTACLKFIENTFGNKYHVTTKSELLTKNDSSANSASSIMMQLNNMRIITISEVRKGTVLDDMQLKKLLSQEKKNERELYGKQEVITVNAPITTFQNYSFIIRTSDHGTWRRIMFYKPKNTFRTIEYQNPNNPFIKLKDTRVIDKFCNDDNYKSAFLSILIHYYEKFRNEYNGDINKCKSQTIFNETEKYKNSENIINKFISEKLKYEPGSGKILTMRVLLYECIQYLQRGSPNKREIIRECDIRDELIESSLKSKFVPRKISGKDPFLFEYEIQSDNAIASNNTDEIDEIKKELE